jgi:hypothetical protein
VLRSWVGEGKPQKPVDQHKEKEKIRYKQTQDIFGIIITKKAFGFYELDQFRMFHFHKSVYSYEMKIHMCTPSSYGRALMKKSK